MVTLPYQKARKEIMEVWKDIPGFENLYQASTSGNIRTAKGKTTSNAKYAKRVWKQRIMKQKIHTNRKGRTDARVELWKDGVHKTHLVSRLIAITFVDGYFDGATVNHKNGITTDNSASNLEWISLTENIRYGFENGQYINSQIPVTLIDKENNHLRFASMSSSCKYIGRNSRYISGRMQRGKTICTSTSGAKYVVSRCT